MTTIEKPPTAPIETTITVPAEPVPPGTFHGDDDVLPRGTFH